MVKIAFLGYEINYQGGINYFKNLFFAVNGLKDKKIDIIVFVGKKDEYQANLYKPYAKVVRTSLLDRMSFLWLVNKFFWRMFRYPLVVDIVCRRHGVDVLSHSMFSGKFLKPKTIFWVPDFQPIVLSHLWREHEVQMWKRVYLEHIKQSNKVILSSQSAFDDFLKFASEYKDKVRILQFVSQPGMMVDENLDKIIREKYSISKPFFYLPNQFWKHKNHKVAFEAVRLLKNKGIEILLFCSGILQDFRNDDNSHVENLLSFVRENELEENIKILGVIDYCEVLWFMKNSLAVINPSLFEGWSSTVEEAKSMGQRVILSDIDVHKEQNPKYGMYFEKNSADSLALLLKEVLDVKKQETNMDEIVLNLNERTHKFALKYQKYVLELLGEKQ